MFSTVLVANRGAIACRVFRTLRRMGIRCAAVYSEADHHSRHVAMADVSALVGPPLAADSYLDIERIVAACRATGAEAVHPGYGFLSENAAFAERLAAEGIRFIGPRPEHLRTFGLKHTARAAAAACNVPLLPGSGLLADLTQAKSEAARIGYPVMIKSTAGGGGIGLQRCQAESELEPLFESVRRLGKSNFGDTGVYVEKLVERARHVEVQIFGDGQGCVIALGERDCSLQRRNQKVIEEAPAPRLPENTRHALHQAAERLGREVAYESAGTVEFIYDEERDQFYFLEVNTRLQVEHGVTEEVTGIDLVEWMIRQAAGERLDLEARRPVTRGWAMQARLYAEDPGKGFLPACGRITHVAFPAEARVDAWIETGTEITPHYDPMLAKIIVRGATRDDARSRLRAALAGTEVGGIETNLAYLATIADSEGFASAHVSTAALASLPFVPRTVDVLAPGAHSSLQDWPGRLGYWHVGVPPSGPMDSLSHRLANRVVGNPEDAAALEMTLAGPTLRFNTDAVICLAGASMPARIGDVAVAFWQPIEVHAGQVLTLGRIDGCGQRSYLAVRHGFDAPLYLNSRSTFALGHFGGHSTGVLRTGDVLHVREEGAGVPLADGVPAALRPAFTRSWELGVLSGPHGAPEFFTDDDIEVLFRHAYEVHFNSARTGVRLIGPKPQWARTDGGEAGLHPSNIHDNAYAVGTLDFTGDMPILLGPDGPSLGGFVCPVTLAQSELWKLGQLAPGDTVRFQLWSEATAVARRSAQDATLRDPLGESTRLPPSAAPTSSGAYPLGSRDTAILDQLEVHGESVTVRRAGEDSLLVEFGPPRLDLTLRFLAHVFMERLQELAPAGVIDLTPGIRSLQIHFDSRVTSSTRMREVVRDAIGGLPPVDDIVVPTRTVHLPLSWDDEATRLAIRKYQELVRPDAPWCPSNIEFIRRINGLADEAAVRSVVYDASYLVLGLGDVYLGAPVATPVDPRHRLVTTKYNPARTWTPENAVGIGGAYLCIYGMEGPGGYQFVGRTVQVWNTWRQTQNFVSGAPWLLRFFDQIRFFPVDAAELTEAREAFPNGAYSVRTEDGVFRLAEYRRFLAANAPSITAFQAGQQAAFAAERQRWKDLGLDATPIEEPTAAPGDGDFQVAVGHAAVESPIAGNVWKVLVEPGDRVHEGQVVVILESMKMEMEVVASLAGRVTEILCRSGRTVAAGQPLVVLAVDD